MPVRLLAHPPSDPSGNGGSQVTAHGSLPATEAAALERINQILGKSGEDALTPEQVYLIYPEAGNSNYVPDRYMFLGRKTLRNVADDAPNGFAFMNSHRTGSLSQPTELPFGQTFAGRYEHWNLPGGGVFRRTLLGAYMLRGQHPNGANGPSTDALYAGIDGGTIRDVSLGLWFGEEICDVCENPLEATDKEGRPLCPHIPGTHRAMTPDQVAKQEARGVPDGVATATLEDSRPGEFSAVYDGAVPGAGFSKAARLLHSGRLAPSHLGEVRAAFRPFWGPSDQKFFTSSGRRLARRPVPLSRGSVMPKIRLAPILEALGLSIEETDYQPDAMIDTEAISAVLSGVTAAKPVPAAPAPAVPAGVTVLENGQPHPAAAAAAPPPTTQAAAPPQPTARELELEKRLAAMEQMHVLKDLETQAINFARTERDVKRCTPAQAVDLGTGYYQALQDDKFHPLADGTKRVDVWRRYQEAAAPIDMFTPKVPTPPGSGFLALNTEPTGGAGGDGVKPSPERTRQLMGMSREGKAALKRLDNAAGNGTA